MGKCRFAEPPTAASAPVAYLATATEMTGCDDGGVWAMVVLRRGLGGQARRGELVVALLALLALELGLLPCRGQAPEADITYTRQQRFLIPFEPVVGQQHLRQVELYYSLDEGRVWRPGGTVAPERRGFEFRAERDGLYWFAVRTVDLDGRASPTTLEGSRPGLKVVVDTQAPFMLLRPMPGRAGSVGVEYEARDDNLDLATLRMDYRLAGSPSWLPLTIAPAATGQHYWNPASNGAVEVRLTVYDRAGNLGETKTMTTPGGAGFQAAHGVPGQGSLPSASGASQGIRMVNSKRINLNFEIRDQGPSGVSVVELWCTQDGRSWKSLGKNPDPKPPFLCEVPVEGLYGFTLVVQSGVGLGDRPPQPGDQPQVWVEVDLAKPIVKLFPPDVGRGPETGNLTITWTASDKNLRQQPITLTYAESSEGPWEPIVANLDNTGRYVWRMPPAVPYQFFVRVEAADRAGNVGEAVTPNLVKVDLAVPKAQILGLEPADAK